MLLKWSIVLFGTAPKRTIVLQIMLDCNYCNRNYAANVFSRTPVSYNYALKNYSRTPVSHNCAVKIFSRTPVKCDNRNH